MESKLESADLEGHKEFLKKAMLPVRDSPFEVIAWENGFVPEALGFPTDKLEHPAAALDDDMQAQCLPVFQVDKPQWTYRKVPKVSSFRSFARIPILV